MILEFIHYNCRFLSNMLYCSEWDSCLCYSYTLNSFPGQKFIGSEAVDYLDEELYFYGTHIKF